MTHAEQGGKASEGAQVSDVPEASETSGVPEASIPRPVPRRRHRRVYAPPTNPAADPSDDVAHRPAEPPPAREDPRDTWFRDERPPHWD